MSGNFAENAKRFKDGEKNIMADYNETAIEHERGNALATITAAETWSINRMLKLKEEYPDKVDILENPDGTIFGHFPAKWLKISPPRKMTEEQVEAARERAKNMRAARK